MNGFLLEVQKASSAAPKVKSHMKVKPSKCTFVGLKGYEASLKNNVVACNLPVWL